MRVLAIIISLMLLTGCESFKLKNALRTTATTVIAYGTGGVAPAVLTLGSSVAINELIPEPDSVTDIETKEQAVAFVADSLFMNILYGFIAFLLITTIVAPWLASKRARKNGYEKAKAKYRILK